MNIVESFIPTFGITNIESIAPEIKASLLELGKKFMMYITWEKQLHFYDETDEEMKLLTFQEIVHQYNGDVDEAMNEFLIQEFYATNKDDYLRWLRGTNPIRPDDLIQGTIFEFLCVMKTFVLHSCLDDLKELLGLEFSLKWVFFCNLINVFFHFG